MLCQCPTCKSQLNIPDTAAGKRVQCSKCKGTMMAPSLQANPPTPLPPPPPPAPPRLPEPVEEEDSPFVLEDQPSPYLTGLNAKMNDDVALERTRPANPGVDPFAPTILTEAEFRTASTHIFQLSQFLDRQRNMLIIGVIAFLIGSLFTVLEAAILVTRGIEPLGLGGVIVFSLCGLGLMAVGLGFFVYCGWKFSAAPRQIKVDANGLWWSNLRGDQSATWPEVNEVWRMEFVILTAGNLDGWSSNVTVKLADGGELTFDHSLAGYKELAAKIQYFTKPLLLAKKSSEWDGGKAEFGPITLMTDRIAISKGANDFYKKEDIAWKDLKYWLVQNGKLDFIGPKGTCSLSLESVPNYHVLTDLLETITSKK